MLIKEVAHKPNQVSLKIYSTENSFHRHSANHMWIFCDISDSLYDLDMLATLMHKKKTWLTSVTVENFQPVDFETI